MSKGFGNTYTSSNKAQFSLNKIKSAGVLGCAAIHNQRIEADTYSYKGEATATHIDPRRTNLNETLFGKDNTYYWKTIVERITGQEYTQEELKNIDKNELYYEDGKKVNVNAVYAFEGKVNFPGKMSWAKFDNEGNIVYLDSHEKPEPKNKGHFMWPTDMNELHNWEEATMSFIKDRFGENNILQAQCHMDETTPHIHVIFTPIYENEHGHLRLSTERIGLSKIGDYARLQDEYSESVAHLGYQRGERFSRNVKSYTAAQWRADAARILDSSLPEPEPGQTIEEYRHQMNENYYVPALVKNQELEIKMNCTNQNGATLQRLRKEKHEDRVKIKEQEDEIRKLKMEINRLQAESKRHECELRGMSLHPDREMVENIYVPLQDSFVEAGIQYYRDRGILIDVNHDGIDDRRQGFQDKDGDGIDDRVEGV